MCGSPQAWWPPLSHGEAPPLPSPAELRRHRHRGRDGDGAGAAAALSPARGISAGGNRVRRRAVLRQRGAVDTGGVALSRLRVRAAAGDHAADGAVGAAGQGDEHGLGPGERAGLDRAGRGRRGGADGFAGAPPWRFRDGGGVRADGRLSRRRGCGSHGAGRAVAGAVLPARRGADLRRRPSDSQPPSAGARRGGVRLRRGGGGLGDRPGRPGPGAVPAQPTGRAGATQPRGAVRGRGGRGLSGSCAAARHRRAAADLPGCDRGAARPAVRCRARRAAGAAV